MLLYVGKTASLSKTFSEEDVLAFMNASGDTNPLHADCNKAHNALFGQRVVPGMLVGSLISGVLGTKMPGPGTVYMEQSLQFLKPVFIGDSVTAVVEVEEILSDKRNRCRYKLKTQVMNSDGACVVNGYAIAFLYEMQ